MITQATVRCPHCGFEKEEIMPERVRVKDYRCAHCQAVLAPRAGECCVFCAYSGVICPPQQEKRNCCSD